MQHPQPHDPVHQVRLVDINQWLQMMGRLDDPVVARLVHAFLSENGAARDQHPGAFLKALETIKRDQIRYAKAYADGKLTGTLVRKATRFALVAMRVCGKLIAAGVQSMKGSGQHRVMRAAAPTQVRVVSRVRCPVAQRRAELLGRRVPRVHA